MKLLIIVLAISLSLHTKADTFGNWNYFLPNESLFTLIPEDNGMYLQFSGEIELVANIAIRAYANDRFGVYVVLDDDMIDYFPYRKRGTIQKPKLIQLINSDSLAKEIIASYGDNLLRKGFFVIGRGKVYLKGFNSSADCETVSYFVFNFKVQNLIRMKELCNLQRKDVKTIKRVSVDLLIHQISTLSFFWNFLN